MSSEKPNNTSYTYWLNLSTLDNTPESVKYVSNVSNEKSSYIRENLSQIDTELINLKKKITKIESNSNIKISNKKPIYTEKQKIPFPKKVTHCPKCSCVNEPNKEPQRKENSEQNDKMIYSLSEQIKIKEGIITNFVNEINMLKNKLSYEQDLNFELSEKISKNDLDKEYYEREMSKLRETLLSLQKENEQLLTRNYCRYCSHCVGEDNFTNLNFDYTNKKNNCAVNENIDNANKSKDITFRRQSSQKSKENDNFFYQKNFSMNNLFRTIPEKENKYNPINKLTKNYIRRDKEEEEKKNNCSYLDLDKPNQNHQPFIYSKSNRVLVPQGIKNSFSSLNMTSGRYDDKTIDEPNDQTEKTRKILSLSIENNCVPKINNHSYTRYQTDNLINTNTKVTPYSKYNSNSLNKKGPRHVSSKSFSSNTQINPQTMPIKDKRIEQNHNQKDDTNINELISKITLLNEELSNNKRELSQSKTAIERLREENQKRLTRKKSEGELTKKRTSNFAVICNPKQNMPNYFSSLNSTQINSSDSSIKSHSRKQTWLSKLNMSENVRLNTINSVKSDELGNKMIFTVLDNKSILAFDSIEKTFITIEFEDKQNFSENFFPKGSLYLNIDSDLYIITGDNCDILYKFDYSNNIMTKLSNLQYNHLLGGLLHEKENNNIICLSGAYNKNVEIFSRGENKWTPSSSMTIERSEAGYIIINSKTIYSFFGYNCPQNIYLNTVEFINNYNDKNSKWKTINIINKSNIDLMIKSHLLFSIEEDKRFVLLGGLCGLNEKPNEIYLDIVISKESDKIEVQPTKRKIFSLNKNKIYSFSYDIAGKSFGEKEVAFYDSKNRVHLLNRINMLHDIFYFD